jgi:hypothetical protein
MRHVFVILMALLAVTLVACNQIASPSQINDSLLEQDFNLTSEGFIENGVSNNIPKLIVRLSIKPETDQYGQYTGKRYGQAAFFWTDKSPANGGSNLSGNAQVILRDAGQTSLAFGGQFGSVLSNLELLRQPNYQGHIVKSSSTASTNPLCLDLYPFVEIQPTPITFQPLLSSQTPITLCQVSKLETKTDMTFTSSMNLGVNVPLGERAVIAPTLMNTGVRPAQDVYATFKINNLMTFIDDTSTFLNARAILFPKPNTPKK